MAASTTSSSPSSTSSSSDSSSSSSSRRERRHRHKRRRREEALKVRKKHNPRASKRKRKHRSISDECGSSDTERDMFDRQRKHKYSEKTKKSKGKDRDKKSRSKYRKNNLKELWPVVFGLFCPLERESYIFKQQNERNGSPVRLSKFLGKDKEENVRCSAISGKKIQLKIDRSKEDKLAENNRNELLKFLNASYD